MTLKEALLNLVTLMRDEYNFPFNLTTEYKSLKQAINELEELKKSPTVEEVCEALSQFYKEQVSYSNIRNNHLFYFEKHRLGIVMLQHENIKFIQGDYHKTNDLPPHLITFIGRFYEGLKWQH